MAKCTDKERELIDAVLRNEHNHELLIEVLHERITKDMKNRLKAAYSKYNEAVMDLGNVRAEFYHICADKNMAHVIAHIESEVDDTK